MKLVKKSAKQFVDTALTGVALHQVGTNFTGQTKGIGDATQSILAVGSLKRAKKRWF